jgi:mannose-6-phosphate isomerase-like protein (cupin superfamily)
MNDKPLPHFRAAEGPGNWAEVPVHAYKQEAGVPFKDITRRVLFSSPELAGELRYFEMAPDGYSTLERHEHVHAVLILRGRGHCLVGTEVRAVAPNDLVYIPSMTWHQFRATEGEPLGFLCLVNATRDKPQLPTEEERAALMSHPAIARFLAA